jgi:hypothetical protein
LIRNGAVAVLSKDYAMLKDREKVANYFKTEPGSVKAFAFEKPLREITAREIGENEIPTFFKKSRDEHSVFKVIDGKVGEYKMRSVKTYALLESEEKRSQVLNDLDLCHNLQKLSNSLSMIRKEFSVNPVMYSESPLLVERGVAAEAEKEVGPPRLLERLKLEFQKEILKGRTPDLTALTPEKMRRHIDDLRKINDHKLIDNYINTVLEFYVKQKMKD